jgi:ATP-binding cassette subfamily B protein
MLDNIKFAWSLMKGNRRMYCGAIISVIIASVLSLISPLVLRVTVDSIIGNEPLDVPAWAEKIILSLGGRTVLSRNLWICGIAYVTLTLAGGVFEFTRGRLSSMASERIAEDIRNRLYRKFQQLPYEYHVNAKTGDLVQRSTSDVDTVRRFLSYQLIEVCKSVFLVTSVVVMMLSMDARMTLVSTSLLPAIFLFAVVFFSRIRNIFGECDEAEGRMSTVLQENLTGVRVVKAFGRQALEFNKFNEKSTEYASLSYKISKTFAWYWSISDFLCLLAIGLVTVYGTYMASTGQISLGTFMVFVSYIGMLLWPVRQMGRILTDMGRMIVGIGRINEVLLEDEEDMIEHGARPEIKGNIVFDNVTFGYDDGNPVLKNISFNVPAGRTVAILGTTGSGKSSLVHLLQGLYSYQEGSIKIDGVELKDIDRKWLRKNVGLVLQEPFLFSRTLRENIAIARPGAREEDIMSAASTVGLDDVASEFESGYDTLVGERGVTLSGGQKQRVAIARSIIRECPILIFDDSLSAVDTQTDANIRRELKERLGYATVFIISHRVTTLSQADLILVLKGGRLVQSGTHGQLMQQEGLYKDIWEIQTSNDINGETDIEVNNETNIDISGEKSGGIR